MKSLITVIVERNVFASFVIVGNSAKGNLNEEEVG